MAASLDGVGAALDAAERVFRVVEDDGLGVGGICSGAGDGKFILAVCFRAVAFFGLSSSFADGVEWRPIDGARLAFSGPVAGGALAMALAAPQPNPRFTFRIELFMRRRAPGSMSGFGGSTWSSPSSAG